MKLSEALDVRPGVTAIIGGGGKTTLMECLAAELAAQARVIVCTTTHIYPEQTMPCLVSPTGAEIRAALARAGCVCVGSVSENGKFSAPELPFRTLCALADYVIVEADGAKRLPCKAPAAHEPVLLPESDWVLAVAGLSAVGRPLGEVCFRLENACTLLGVGPEVPLTPALLAKLLASDAGGRKNVGARRFAAVLNQADTPERQAAGKTTQEILQTQYGVTAVLTQFSEEERA